MNAAILNMPQGSPEWLAFYATSRSASKLPAAKGNHEYMSRSELLSQLKYGITKDVDAYTQALFDKGHAAEIAGRIMAEKIIGEELSPVVMTRQIDGLTLAASLDGINFEGDIEFECKLWNEKLAANVRAGTLDPHYTDQLDQQLLVAKAKKTLFMVTDGTEEKCVWMWYETTQAKMDAVVAAWKQVEADILTYVPPEVIAPIVSAPIMQLPALTIQVNGAITLTDNLAVFGEKLQSFIGGLNTKPEDDQGFADIEAAVKVLQKAQDALEASEASALAQVASVDEMRRTVALYVDLARNTRLMLDKVVKQRKEAIRSEMIAMANDAFRQHLESLEAEIYPTRLAVAVFRPDFAQVAKNKRTLASLSDAINTELANAKAGAEMAAKDIRGKLAWGKVSLDLHPFLFRDLQTIIQKPLDDFKLVVKSRVIEYNDQQGKKLEAERARIQAEEQAKAEAKVRADQAEVARLAEDMARAKAEVLAQADRERQAELKSLGSMDEWPVEPGLSNLKKAALSTPKQPSRSQMIEAVAAAFGVSESTASDWLINEFQQRAA
ncbi:MAG: hypothetical protein A2V79_11720 [Betaproteobacteria bacterium RBG_16_56_24]|nr:MAG: hypothetical protein A2V79_11720 [Betaproteobacteria bacterium RBG_16_56_24]